ncbi:unnamed protein product [Paramecium primaurelia]|uniref:Uncharacterized protein n=1 Tax=Paramecium primaurelia TaxID=5886 RepID=A0A8S1KQW4_PARPR|nr:unnamed protein product [Paramecium primaurelia]
MNPSPSFKEMKPIISEDKALNSSCYCSDCGGKISKKLLLKYDKDQHQLDNKFKNLDLDKIPKNLDNRILSSANPSIHIANNGSKKKIKYKPFNHLLQMVHVKSVLSKLVNSKPIKQQQQVFQSSPQTISEFTQKTQNLKTSISKDIQSPLIGKRLKTEPIIQHQQQLSPIDTKKFYYPRISRISQIAATGFLNLNLSDRTEIKPVNHKLIVLTSRYKSPDIQQVRTLSQRIQSIYLKKSDLKLKDNNKRQN